MPRNLENHPCFNDAVRDRYARVHLPVARSCNIQCRFCNRQYDCVNESRPGVTSAVLTPIQAFAYLRETLARDPRTSVVGIAGPGDPLAESTATLETLTLVRDAYPDLLLCVATNGLKLPELAGELARLKVSHVTVTVNAIDPAIGARIYAWVRDGKRLLRREEGAGLLIARQLLGIARLKEHGVTVKVNTIIIPGVNDEHIAEVAHEVGKLGADIMNCIPLYPVKGSEWEALPIPPPSMIHRVRKAAGAVLPQMHHCTRCRADAAGLLGDGTGEETIARLKGFACTQVGRDESRPYDRRGAIHRAQGVGHADTPPYVAVASMEGMLVNQHAGEATRLWIFGQRDEGFQVVEMRDTPPAGGGRSRWECLAAKLRDCRAILVSGAGHSPTSVLEENGIQVIEMEGLIEPALQAVYSGREVHLPMRRSRPRCGVDCSGSGNGCG
ncbi:MAG: nitrogenase cofactor biosynthesis protein NifB [Chloroflexota bacterium]|nr:MAG: nitrogenase cofactor biosynthesis protein NifB [Chloroflexota bacterium]